MQADEQIRMIVQVAGHGTVELLNTGFCPGLILCMLLDLARDSVLKADDDGTFLNF